jgi:hypothetical protein
MSGRNVVHSTFTLERKYAASPSVVFGAWADPEMKARWFGGNSDTTSWLDSLGEHLAEVIADDPPQLPYMRIGVMRTAARRSSAMTRSYSSQSSCSPPAATKISRSRSLRASPVA